MPCRPRLSGAPSLRNPRPSSRPLCRLDLRRRCAGDARRWLSSAPALRLLEHHHLVGSGPGGLIPYDVAQAAQEDHRAAFLAWKALPDAQRSASSCPKPRLLSFECAPTFTLGRRQDELLPSQKARLEHPLEIDLVQRRDPLAATFAPEVRKTSRGGLTTYHGPGQLVLWPVLDMHSPLHGRYGVASYASLLEATTRRLLLEEFGLQTHTNPDEPGVWASAEGRDGQQERKIAAMGVHHRRYVTALGIAVNVDVPVKGPEEVNPWARFVPCGLEGKLVTSVAAEMGPRADGLSWDVKNLAERWATIFEDGLLDGVNKGVGSP